MIVQYLEYIPMEKTLKSTFTVNLIGPHHTLQSEEREAGTRVNNIVTRFQKRQRRGLGVRMDAVWGHRDRY